MIKSHELLVKNQVGMAGIPYGQRALATKMITEAIDNLLALKMTEDFLFCPMSQRSIAKRPIRSTVGRPSLEAQATYIISVLRYVWMKTLNKKPTVNRRGHSDSSFVQFAEPILKSLHIFNVLDNLSRYSSSTRDLRS